MIKKNHSAEFVTLWKDSRGNRAPLVATIVIRILIAVSFVMFVIAGLFEVSEELNQFGTEMEKASALDTNVVEKSETILRQFRVDEQSEFLGKTMRESGIREKYHCLIVGVERGEEALHAPDPHEPFMEDDVVWVVGEKADVYKLVGQKNENIDME